MTPLLTLLLLLVNLAASLRPTDLSQERELLDNKIKETKRYLDSLPDMDPTLNPKTALALGDAWRYYASLLQTKDMQFPSGGGKYQVQTLNAFNNALHYANENDAAFTIDISIRKTVLLKMMGHIPEALVTINKGLETCYRFSDICSHNDEGKMLNHKALALMTNGSVPVALDTFKASINVAPNIFANYLGMVECYKELKSLNKQEWKRVLEALEIVMQAYKAGASLVTAESDIYGKESIISYVKDEGDNDSDTSIFWALFHAADKAELYNLAWKYLGIAHEYELSIRPKYDANISREQLRHIKNIFIPTFWIKGIGSKSTLPIFVIGMMRSGSTLLENMFDAHRDILGMGEDSIFNANLQELKDKLISLAADGRDARDLQKVVTEYAKKVDKLMTETAKKDNINIKFKHIVDKMLFNYRSIGFIHYVYPEAVIVHMVRDPMDTLLSCFTHKFDHHGLEWSMNEDNLVDQFVIYLQIMNHFRRVLPGRIIDVRYEELVNDPERVLRPLLGRMKVDWDPNVLDYFKFNRIVQTHSQSQVRHSVYNSSIGSWRRYNTELQSIKSKLLPRIDALLEEGQLPFTDKINWRLEANYDYRYEG